MKGRLGRRSFLRASALAGGALAASPLRALTALAETVEITGEPVALRAPRNGGYGPCCFWHRGRAVIVSTSGGDAQLGQVWEYRPAAGGGRLSLLFESPSADLLRMPDNVVATPRGGLLLCEDGPGPDHLRGLTGDGRVFNFARNRFSDGEFAGATFSPDGRVLFVNVQTPGATFAITGPWRRGSL